MPLFDIVLSDSDLLAKNPEFAKIVEEVKQSVTTDTDTCFQTAAEVLTQYEVVEKRRESGEGFYTTGYASLDRYLTEGFAPKKVTILAGRPGMGKSAFAVNIMKNLAYQGIHTAQLILEMDKISFMDRLLSSMGLIELDKIVKNRDLLTPNERATLELMKQRLRNNEYLHLNDKASPTIAAARKMVQDLQMKIGQKYLVLVIDLVDKVKDVLSSSDNLQGSFHLTLNSLQTMAKDLDIHLILVAQINRESEKKSDKRPTLVNLKHSGAFEEVADLILFVDRPSYRMMDEDTAEVDTQFDKINLLDSFEFQSTDSYMKKYENSDMFDSEDDHLTKGKQKDDKKEFNKQLKADKMVQVGNIVLPIDQYAEVIIAKQRQGVSNKVIPFVFKGPYSSFTSMHLVSSYVE
jgi:replicative DNA helicase